MKKTIRDEIFKTNKTDYIKLFPSFYLLHTFDKSKSLGINYSRRINRPNYESLNPFRMIQNEYVYNEGNPFLKPAFTHNLELTFTYKKFDNEFTAEYLFLNFI